MAISQIYLIVAIIVLIVLAALAFFINKKKKPEKLTPLAGIGFGFIIAGIIFNDNQIFGYGLLGVGVILSIIDIIIKLRKKK